MATTQIARAMLLVLCVIGVWILIQTLSLCGATATEDRLNGVRRSLLSARYQADVPGDWGSLRRAGIRFGL